MERMGAVEDMSEMLSHLSEDMKRLKKRDEELCKEESRVKKLRDELKPEIQRLGRLLEASGLPVFSDGEYKLEQGITMDASCIDDPVEKEQMVQWFKDKGLYHKYVKVDGRSLPRLAREWSEQGEAIPGIVLTERWYCKITKG